MNDVTPTPKNLGDFEIIRHLGRGGMGVVYEARQKSLGRHVALKVLMNGLGLTEKAIRRFQQEAKAAAKLHHTNIVPVYATGQENGVYFYAMELVDGPSANLIVRQMRSRGGSGKGTDSESTNEVDEVSLPDWAAETIAFKKATSVDSTPASTPNDGLSDSGANSGQAYFDTVAAMMADVADALQHAHDHGVIHRDIKPSNLLLSRDGRLSITDFGLAQILEQPGMTMSGEFLGTPRYMSPEQISAGRTRLDHRTDVYSFGATLYELLTMQPVFAGTTRNEVIGQILHKEPKRPRRLNRAIPADLETICLKALERDPDRRYQSAGQMAADLRNYVNRFAISARRVGPVGRAIKWIRRNPVVAALLIVLCVMALVIGGLFYLYERVRSERIAHANDTLLLHAFNDQFLDAREQLAIAAANGAAADQQRLMQAQIDLLEGNHEDVVIDLERIKGPLAQSMAKDAMLTIAYMHVGREADCFRRLPGLVTAPTPKNYQDLLLRGWAQTMLLPPGAVQDLEKANLQRPNIPVAQALLADALAWNALSQPDRDAALRDAQRAVAIISARRQLVAKTPWTEGLFVFASMIEADLLGKTEADRHVLRRKLLGDVVDLKQWSGTNEMAGAVRTSYLQQQKMTLELSADFQQPVPPKSPYSHVHHAIELFRAGEDDRALAAIRKIPITLGNSVAHMSVYVEMSKPNVDRERLAASFFDQCQRRANDPLAMVYRHFDVWGLQLLGLDKEAREFAASSRESTLPLNEYWPHFQSPNIVTGEWDPQQLLDSCSGDRSALAHAHFATGVNALANDNREDAREHFENVLETGFFPNYVYSWSKAFLQRMDNDDNWLPWLKKHSNQDDAAIRPDDSVQ